MFVTWSAAMDAAQEAVSKTASNTHRKTPVDQIAGASRVG
jgi:hypothetical protein